MFDSATQEAAQKLQTHLHVTAEVAHMLLHAGFPTVQSLGRATPNVIALSLSALPDTDPVKLHDNLDLIRRIVLIGSIELSTYASGAMGEIDLLTRSELARYGIREEDDFDNLTGDQMQRKMKKPRGG